MLMKSSTTQRSIRRRRTAPGANPKILLGKALSFIQVCVRVCVFVCVGGLGTNIAVLSAFVQFTKGVFKATGSGYQGSGVRGGGAKKFEGHHLDAAIGTPETFDPQVSFILTMFVNICCLKQCLLNVC
jgi:hypothetical protein